MDDKDRMTERQTEVRQNDKVRFQRTVKDSSTTKTLSFESDNSVVEDMHGPLNPPLIFYKYSGYL